MRRVRAQDDAFELAVMPDVDGVFCRARHLGAGFDARIEAGAKVTGAAKYTVDIRHDGQLEGVILRSNTAHAKITSIDLAPARAIPGVAAAVSLLGDDSTVRFVGAP